MSDRIAGRIDQGIDTRPACLVIGTSNLEIEGRDGIVGGGDVGVEVGLGDIFSKIFTPICKKSVSCGCLRAVIRFQSVPCAVEMAAIIGLASSKVRVE